MTALALRRTPAPSMPARLVALAILAFALVSFGGPQRAIATTTARFVIAAEGATADDATISGILRDATKGKGNFRLGAGSNAQADLAGEAWVGPNYTVASDGKTLISSDGLRQYRPPTYKPNLGSWQANFEERYTPNEAWQSNGHLDVPGSP